MGEATGGRSSVRFQLPALDRCSAFVIAAGTALNWASSCASVVHQKWLSGARRFLDQDRAGLAADDHQGRFHHSQIGVIHYHEAGCSGDAVAGAEWVDQQHRRAEIDGCQCTAIQQDHGAFG